MHAGALRILEFDRIVTVVAGLTVTPTGLARVSELAPHTDTESVLAALRATTEGTRFLSDQPGFPLRAPADLDAILEALGIEGRALEPLRLTGLADYLESIESTRKAVTTRGASFPILVGLVAVIASFKGEIAEVRRTIDQAGVVADHASPMLASIRDRLRKQRARLRTTLESFLRGKETSKYLQDQVVTDRNGRYVLIVRAEHRSAIPGVVHGASASGASLFLEPLGTVEINNDVVALEDEEAEEVRRILLELTDAFRERPADLDRTIDVATELDAIQARARFSLMVDGVEPVISADEAFELRGARHPLLITDTPVPVDILLTPPARVLVITGPNTGGKTVALKTAGLFAAMAQAGLHLPVEKGSRLPVFQTLFADIGDEQSISASLSTFSAHVANIVSMDRSLALPALVLLDEVGAGTDPAEGGALGTAVIDHFRTRGAHLVATTHYDALKTYASTTTGVVSAAFGFEPSTFAPTYRLIYGSPGRSLALEIAARLGMPATVIAAARGNLGERETQLAAHLERVDRELGALEQDRRLVGRERADLAEADRKLRSRETAVREREHALRRRLDAKIDDQLRAASQEIETVIEGLKARVSVLTEKGSRRSAITVSTGEAGAARAEARAALDAAAARFKAEAFTVPQTPPDEGLAASTVSLAPGVRVEVGALGLEDVVLELHGKHAEVDVRGKRLRASVRELRIIGGAAPPPSVNITVDLQPRTGSLSELNVIGCTVDEAITRVERFLDESTVTDLRELRLVHGHGTGQLRRAIAGFLKHHPLVAKFELALLEHGGAGVTVVELKD